jgi:plasmid rolling circle replication initiator protein Rep
MLSFWSSVIKSLVAINLKSLSLEVIYVTKSNTYMKHIHHKFFNTQVETSTD